jgi:acyl-CoA reductase-like NAD-dependent aldehyde dehydrogenase
MTTGTTVATALAGQHVGGRVRTGSGPLMELRSPRDGALVATVRGATADDVRAAYDSAEAAWPSWRDASPRERARVLEKAAAVIEGRADELALLISREMGKSLADATNEVTKGVDVLHYYAFADYGPQGSTYRSDTGDDVTVVREPRGCTVLVSPWNFPFTLPLRKVAAALVTGNVAILKPAPGGVLIALAIVDAFVEAGIPDGALNLIYGEIEDIQDALFSEPRLAAVSFTGSWPSAQAIRQRVPVHVPLQAELGGKNALVVWEDADVTQAVDIIVASALPNNGQVCTSAGRVLVHERIAQEVLDSLRSAFLAREAGEQGVLASRQALERVKAMIDENTDAAAEIVRPPWPEELMAPTLVVEPENGPWTDEEIFGPVITFETFSDLDEAIGLANGTRYGLTAGIVTRDLDVAHRFWTRSTAGTVKVNGPLTGTPFHIALEGFGQSGAGHGEGGVSSLDFFTRRKTLYLRRG